MIQKLLALKDYFDRGRYWVAYGQSIILVVVLINTSSYLSKLGNKMVVLICFVLAYFVVTVAIGWVEKKTKLKDMINLRVDSERPTLQKIARKVYEICEKLNNPAR